MTKEEIALARTLKGPSQMQRVRAARELINGRVGSGEALALQAFMAIFHPSTPDDTVREMVLDVRKRTRGY